MKHHKNTSLLNVVILTLKSEVFFDFNYGPRTLVRFRAQPINASETNIEVPPNDNLNDLTQFSFYSLTIKSDRHIINM